MHSDGESGWREGEVCSLPPSLVFRASSTNLLATQAGTQEWGRESRREQGRGLPASRLPAFDLGSPIKSIFACQRASSEPGARHHGEAAEEERGLKCA